MPNGTALLEIGTEELPPRFFYEAIEQLKFLSEKKLKDHRLSFEKIFVYGTPRRLVLEVRGLIEHQPDLKKEVRGPAESSAYDKERKPTQALLGFLKSQNLSLNSVKSKDFSGKPYVVVEVHQIGKSAVEILAMLFPEIMRELTFPKSMRWNGDMSFGRPIRWLLALYEDSLVPFELEGLHSAKLSYGHRFLSQSPFEISNPAQYQKVLEKNYVVVDHEVRKEKIRHQVESLAHSKGAQAYRMDSLLEEVALLLEYPTAFLGSFDKEFLALPQEVLVTVMQHHQRYFPLVTSDGKLLPYFAAVRNGNQDGLNEVRFGNEQVLRARFKDAMYFFEKDKETHLLDRLAVLDKLVFQKKLGTIRQKIDRVHGLVQFLLKRGGFENRIDIKELEQAVNLCKCDLATQMVFEFPELQGVMGKEYARIEGCSERVAQAILDHYLPRFQGDDFPRTMEGTILGIADRVDTLVGCFALDLRPTGSSDPLGLRRAATSLVSLLLEKHIDINLEELIMKSFEEYKKQFPELGKTQDQIDLKIFSELKSFMVERAETLWKLAGIRYDLIRAFEKLIFEKPHSTLRRAQFLESLRAKDKEKFVQFVLAWVRILNILKSKEAKIITKTWTQEGTSFSLSKAPGSEEKELWSLFQKQEGEVKHLLSNGNHEKLWMILSGFEGAINLFFDKVLVMAPEEDLRKNRLALLWNLQTLILGAFGDLTQIVLD